ncbi:MFS transporter [Flavihumibacter sp. R14]|nr:MFS transporter [Flavihumibacter soli]
MQTQIKNSETNSKGRSLLLAVCLVCCAFCGYFATLMSVYLPVVVRELVGNVGPEELGEVSAWIASMFLFGWMLGGIFFGFLGDKIGRLKAFSIAVILYSSLNILIGFTQNWVLIVALRFISGIGVGGTLVVATILIAEVWPARSRAIALGILAVTFPVGIVSAGIANNAFSDWRTAFLPGMIPLTAAVTAILFLKESTEWTRLQKPGNQQGSTSLLLTENRNNIIKGSLIFGTMLIGLWAIFSWMPTWVQSLFADPGQGQTERGITMMLLGGGGIIGGALSGFLINYLGYKRTLLIAFAGSFLMCFLLFKTNRVFSEIIYLESALLAIFFGISQGALSSYLPELFPTHIRSTATGFCFNIGRLATAAVVFFVGTLVTVLGGYGNAVLVFSITFLIGFAVTLLSPEARPHTEASII